MSIYLSEYLKQGGRDPKVWGSQDTMKYCKFVEMEYKKRVLGNQKEVSK